MKTMKQFYKLVSFKYGSVTIHKCPPKEDLKEFVTKFKAQCDELKAILPYVDVWKNGLKQSALKLFYNKSRAIEEPDEIDELEA